MIYCVLDMILSAFYNFTYGHLVLICCYQVRPGMDLSKVVLPTFILEPRSFLDKLSDYYYHADMLSV